MPSFVCIANIISKLRAQQLGEILILSLTMYIPCMDEEAQALLDEYEKSGDPDIADHLIESLDAARRARWWESTAWMNFTHSSLKSWGLLHRLCAAQCPPQSARPPVSAKKWHPISSRSPKLQQTRLSNVKYAKFHQNWSNSFRDMAI